MRLFSGISQHVIEAEKKDDFCRAIIDKIAECSFDSV
jgi:type I restriction enzyme M protein